MKLFLNRNGRPLSLLIAFFILGEILSGCGSARATAQSLSGSPSSDTSQNDDAALGKKTIQNDKETKPATPWVSLTDHWVASEFGGEGDVTIKDGLIKMEYGDPLTGVHWTGPFVEEKKTAEVAPKQPKTPALSDQSKPLPRDNYEVRWESRRDKGYDFMCAFTFPVADKHASLVMGGWGGGITGISSIDGNDASDNETTMFKAFENDQWYKARVRVETKQITVWIDGTLMFEQPREDHEFDIRFEMDPCTPLGIANFECDSSFRNIQIRPLDAKELVNTK